MAFDPDRLISHGAQPIGETHRGALPALVEARGYADLADSLHDPRGADAELVKGAAEKVSDQLSNGLNVVDVNAMIIAGINRTNKFQL